MVYTLLDIVLRDVGLMRSFRGRHQSNKSESHPVSCPYSALCQADAHGLVMVFPAEVDMKIVCDAVCGRMLKVSA